MLEILYSDSNIAVIIKPAGISSEHTDKNSGAADLLKEQLKTEVYPVHRLDLTTGGVMVYALNKKSAGYLSRAIEEKRVVKQYLAITDGIPKEDKAVLKDLLYRDKQKNKTFVVKRMRKGVKDAECEYEIIKKSESRALIKVRLFTGRTHQIRVQFASRKTPLTGDGKYGSRTNTDTIALWSYALTIQNPTNGKTETYTKEPDFSKSPWNLI